MSVYCGINPLVNGRCKEYILPREQLSSIIQSTVASTTAKYTLRLLSSYFGNKKIRLFSKGAESNIYQLIKNINIFKNKFSILGTSAVAATVIKHEIQLHQVILPSYKQILPSAIATCPLTCCKPPKCQRFCV